MSRPTSDLPAGFDEIYQEHRVAVYAYLVGRLGNRESAADLLQETFLRVWRRLPELSGLSADRQRAWIFTAAKNLVIDSYRARAAHNATKAAMHSGGAAATAGPLDDPSVMADYTDRRTQVDKAIERLPEAQRVVLALHLAGNLSSAEVGEQLGVPPGTVRYRLSEARRKLTIDLALDG